MKAISQAETGGPDDPAGIPGAGGAGPRAGATAPRVGPPSIALSVLFLAACHSARDAAPEPRRTATPAVTEVASEVSGQGLATDAAARERVLFDGADLSLWRTGVFGDPPDYELVEDGVVLPQTDSLSGMTYTGEAPRPPYRLTVEATRRYGSDFFLGVTFPVRDAHLTLVLGGWGGTVTGLSCLDGSDAANNITATYRDFPNGKRMSVTLDVTDERIVAAVDDDVVVDLTLDPELHLSLRPEVVASRPLGLAAYATSTVVHSVRAVELSNRSSGEGGALDGPAEGPTMER